MRNFWLQQLVSINVSVHDRMRLLKLALVGEFQAVIDGTVIVCSYDNSQTGDPCLHSPE